MTRSQKKIVAVILILVVCGAAAFSLVARGRRQAAAEAEAHKALAAIGALVTMDSNQQHIQGIALLSSTKQEDLEKTIHLAAGLPYLEVLRLAGTGVTDELLAQIAGNTSLTMLGLNNTAISDKGLEHLQNLNNLVALYLNGTQVSDQGLKFLRHLSELEILGLSDTRLKGDLADLLPLAQLNHLLLAGVGLNDAAVNNLLQLKSLSRLSIRSNVVSNDLVSKVEKAGIKVDLAEEENEDDGKAGEEADNGQTGDSTSQP